MYIAELSSICICILPMFCYRILSIIVASNLNLCACDQFSYSMLSCAVKANAAVILCIGVWSRSTHLRESSIRRKWSCIFWGEGNLICFLLVVKLFEVPLIVWPTKCSLLFHWLFWDLPNFVLLVLCWVWMYACCVFILHVGSWYLHFLPFPFPLSTPSLHAHPHTHSRAACICFAFGVF